MAGGGGSIESGEPEFQIAPMIDVLLVLLIFFISITSMEVLRIDQDIALPVAGDATRAQKERGEVILNVRYNDKTRKARFNINADTRPIEDTTTLITELTKAVAVAKTSIKAGWNPNVRLVIRADKQTPSFEISRAMNAGAEAGISDIAFSAASRDDTATP
jgi:biopolymer transport protein ExbD